MKKAFVDLYTQVESFVTFLLEGFREELEEIRILECGNFTVRFYLDGIRFKRPRFSSYECRLNSETYASSVFVPVQVIYKKRFKSNIQNLCFAKVPLATDSGNFIIFGIAKVIINQIVKSPGIYFRRELGFCSATIVPSSGSYLTIEKRNDFFWVVLNKSKIPIFVFLQAIGLTQKKIFFSVQDPKFLAKSLVWGNPFSTLQALNDLRVRLHFKDVQQAKDFLSSFFFKNNVYNLGKVGRMHLNSRLKISDSCKDLLLRPEDILAALNFLMFLNPDLGSFNDFDSFENKRIRSCGELIRSEIRSRIFLVKGRVEKTLHFLERNLVSRNSGVVLEEVFCKGVDFLVKALTLNKYLHYFFSLNSSSQFMDEVNPLSEITHKRKVCPAGHLGNASTRAGLGLREIHPTQYGRICPIETPEGLNAGLVGSLALYARVNNLGFVEIPFYQLKSKNLKNGWGFFYLTSKQEEEISSKVLASFLLSVNEVYFRGVSPIQAISLATSLIPFLEHNDANRVLMGSNMQRQAVPLVTSYKPIVGTGLESIIAYSGGSMLLSRESGFIEEVNSKRIVLNTWPGLNPIKVLDKKSYWEIFSKNLKFYSLIKETVLHSYLFSRRKIFKSLSSNFIKNKTKIEKKSKKIFIPFLKEDRKVYNLKSFQRSNQSTLINHFPVVQKKEWIFRGELLADGSATKNGELALGANILVAYMSWEGYNFEDAIVISESLIRKNIFTSIHIEKFVTKLGQTPFGIEIVTRNLRNVDVTNLDQHGVIVPGSWVKGGDILVGKLTPMGGKFNQTPEGKLLCAIFSQSLKNNLSSNLKRSFLKVPFGVEGRILDVQIFDKVRIEVFLAQKKRVQVGDKISGRHGNKGIISKVLPDQDMPYTQDGSFVDIILNPLGVPSRMNVGQLLECLLGLAGMYLKENYRIVPFDEIFGFEISRKFVYHKLLEAKEKTRNSWIFQPSNPGKSLLFDGRSGEVFLQPITVGFSYILKLNHLVDNKIQARSVGSYAVATEQPLSGRSRNGGQRLGEMEVWALEGFGAAYNLKELLTIKSDDIKGRDFAYEVMIDGKNCLHYGMPESFKVLIRELQALCLDLGLFELHVG
uniref:DNA-directed RNA polymerase subunit beta n=1 Tax=Eutreptiella sp. CCMP389 TaxID=96781 RepID=A0A977K849_9EUGL|nr:RNA polymerase beta subunit [Eutreptiella sp. CCMP389]